MNKNIKTITVGSAIVLTCNIVFWAIIIFLIFQSRKAPVKLFFIEILVLAAPAYAAVKILIRSLRQYGRSYDYSETDKYRNLKRSSVRNIYELTVRGVIVIS